MAGHQPCLGDKLAHFNLIEALNNDQDEESDTEWLYRQHRMRFFSRRTPTGHDGPQQSARQPIQRNAPNTTSLVKATQEPRETQRRRLPRVSTPNEIVPETVRATRIHTVTEKQKASKRKREEASRSEAEQIFKGLSFFYIPNDDVAPARRMRIQKAREFGATWTREVMAATHVVVDGNVEYEDVLKIVGGDTKAIVVVNDGYPVDCVRFRALLDPTQKKYQVLGQPLAESSNAVEDGCSKRGVDIFSAERPRAKDYVAGCNADLDADNHDVAKQSEREADDRVEASGGDELSHFISMMQEYKDLPLDLEDEVDDRSAADEQDVHSDPEECASDEEDASCGSNERLSSERHESQKPAAGKIRKAMRFQDRFACNRGGAQDAISDNPNVRTIQVLQDMASYYDRVNDQWRTMGYRKAITTLKQQKAKITTEEEAFRLPHVGRRLAQKIEEIVMTDKLRRLAYAQDEATDGALQLFLGVYGVGTRQAQTWLAQGHRTLNDLVAKAKLTPSQRIGIDRYDDLNTRIPRHEVEALGTVVRSAASHIDQQVRLIIGGSYRRGASSSNDIDLIVTKDGTESVAQLRPFLADLVTVLEKKGFLTAKLASFHSNRGDGSKWHGCCVLTGTPAPAPTCVVPNATASTEERKIWRRIDFLLVPETERGGALIYFTGNDIFNRSMRLLARTRGLRLNQRGLYREGELLEGQDERRIFDMLGVKWREPQERWC